MNSSFTQLVDTGYLGTHISVAKHWDAINTVDYSYDSIEGHTHFCGLTLNQPREFLIGSLLPLVPAAEYEFQIQVLSRNRLNASQLGILFLTDHIHFATEFELLAHQRTHPEHYVGGLKTEHNKKRSWTLFKTTFKAKDQYRYFIIGYFGKEELSKPVYFFVDDIAVRPLQVEGRDKTLK